MRICKEKPNKLQIENVLLTGGQFHSLSSPVVARTPPQTRNGRCPVEEQLFGMYNCSYTAQFWLTDDHLRKSVKSQLETELLLGLGEEDSFKEAWALCQDILWHWFALTAMLTKAWHNFDEIHIVFDHYRQDSIKKWKRRRRGNSQEMIVLDMMSLNQIVPVVVKTFGCLSSTKRCSRQSMQVAYYRLPILKTCIRWCMAGVGWVCFSIP